MLAVLRNADGTIHLVSLVGKRLLEEDDAAYVRRLIAYTKRLAKDKNPELAAATYVGQADPRSISEPLRRFRKAWRYNAGNVDVDLDAAKAVAMDAVRDQRNALLDASDKEQARLADVGTADQLATLKSYRQALRDLPATVQRELDEINDAEGLAAYVPAFPKLLSSM